MGQYYTVQNFQVKKDKEGNVKKDHFQNTQLDVKFVESAETVYKAVKDVSTVKEGETKWFGRIEEGQYGPKFVREDPDGQAPATTAPQPTQAPQASNELLELVKDNNRMLKALVGEDSKTATEATNDASTDDEPPLSAYDEPDFGG
jgi:hypothetical protein